MFKPKFAFHPGEYISDELVARKWSQRKFADIIDISAPELNAIIKGKKNLTPALCVRIGEAFGTGSEVWMNLQTGYSLEKAKNDEDTRIRRVHEKLKEYGYEDLSLLSDDELYEELGFQPEKKEKIQSLELECA